MCPNKDSNLIQPIPLTWEYPSSAADFWAINAPINLKSASTSEINEWVVETFSKILEAFSHFARAWEVAFQPSPFTNNEGNIVVFKYFIGSPYRDYIAQVLQAMREYEKPIWRVSAEVDLFVYVYTKQEQRTPEQGWVRHLADFRIDPDVEYESPSLSFGLNHAALFQAFSHNYQASNSRQLHSLNQPLLEKALHQWEQSVGEIAEFSGPLGCYKYGFLSDAEAYGEVES